MDLNEEVINHFKYVKSPFFEQIKDGRKISEARLNKCCDTIYNEGDIIKFYNNDNGEVLTRVLGINVYKNFDEMLRYEMKNVLPEINSIEDGLKVYRSIYTNRAEEERLGVIVIHFELF